MYLYSKEKLKVEGSKIKFFDTITILHFLTLQIMLLNAK